MSKAILCMLLALWFTQTRAVFAQDILVQDEMDMNILIPVGSDIPMKYGCLDRMVVRIESSPIEGYVWKVKVLNSSRFGVIRKTEGRIRKRRREKTIEIRTERVVLAGFRQWKKKPPVLVPYLEKQGKGSAVDPGERVPFYFRLTQTVRPLLLSRLLERRGKGVVQNIYRHGYILNPSAEDQKGIGIAVVRDTASDRDDTFLIFKQPTGREESSYVFSRNHAPFAVTGDGTMQGGFRRSSLQQNVEIPIRLYVVGEGQSDTAALKTRVLHDIANANHLFRQNCAGLEFKLNWNDDIVLVDGDCEKCSGFTCHCTGGNTRNQLALPYASPDHLSLFYCPSSNRNVGQTGYSCNYGCQPSQTRSAGFDHVIWQFGRDIPDWILPHELGHFLHLCHGDGTLLGSHNLMRNLGGRLPMAGRQGDEPPASQQLHTRELLTFGQVIKANFSPLSGIHKFSPGRVFRPGYIQAEKEKWPEQDCDCLTQTLYRPVAPNFAIQ